MMAIVIRLIGGPMYGVEHELFGNLVPAAIGINQPEDPKSPEKYWYYLSDDESVGNVHLNGRFSAGNGPMMDDQRRLACRIIDHIADVLAIEVAVVSHGRNAEGGWTLEAWREDNSERWTINSKCLYEASCELASLVGIELEDG